MIKDLSDLYGKTIDELTSGIEINKKRKLNFFAIVSAVIFNFFAITCVEIAVLSIFLAVWTTLFIFVITPFVLTFLNIFDLQKFDWKQTLLAVGICILSIKLLPLLYKFTKILCHWFIKYVRFNYKSMFQ